ncbi:MULTISPECIES: hypothetical protein [unclassified Xanthobacter]|uniref:hypothetical protein n=1 Tax=unclassified Xanthobacter TaxID=2623496 RepID=UPI001EDDCE51|nr:MULTISPECIES: hypothetical protein [unclassified Xanthobacter]
MSVSSPTPDGPPPARAALRSRGSLLLEAALLGALTLLVVFVVIPAETSAGGIGLSPAFLPTVCAAAAGFFAVVDALLRVLRAEPSARYPEGWTAFFRIGAVAVAGVVILAYAGPGACALVTVPAGMAMLGERRPLPLLAAGLVCGGIFRLLVG